jgi:hypothetical protein
MHVVVQIEAIEVGALAAFDLLDATLRSFWLAAEGSNVPARAGYAQIRCNKKIAQ